MDFFKSLAKPLPVVEDRASRRIYETIVQAGRPLSALELLERGNVSNGSLHPLLQRRIHAKILVDGLHDGDTTYDLTPEGYWRIRDDLLQNGTDEAMLHATDERFSYSRPSSN